MGKRRPYWVEFPGATPDRVYVRDHNETSLENAIGSARAAIHRVMRADPTIPANDADIAVITNRDTGYRWILHRGSPTVEFQTPGMLEEQVALEQIDVYLSVEEAEALAEALADAAESAESAALPDKRTAAIVQQAAEQIRVLARQVREAHRRADPNAELHGSLRRKF